MDVMADIPWELKCPKVCCTVIIICSSSPAIQRSGSLKQFGPVSKSSFSR